jgi:gluconolactonase
MSMRSLFVTLLTAAAVSSVTLAANTPAITAQQVPDPSREMAATEIHGVIAAGTKIQLVRAGFDGTEGVISMADGSVLFCEFNVNKIIHIDAAGHFSTYLEDANRSIGLGFDPAGRLIAAQSRDPRVGVLSPIRLTLADSFEGQSLVRPNDLVIDRKGGIYFSDPLPPRQLQFREPPPGRKSLLFYITSNGKLVKLTEDVSKPNGVQLSPDERTLYAVDGDQIVVFDVQPDGTVRNLRRFAEVAGGDGLAVDSEGRLYVATPQGVQVVDPTGHLLGLIPLPVRIQSIAFAGADRKSLYAVGQGAVYRIPLRAAGVKGRAK